LQALVARSSPVTVASGNVSSPLDRRPTPANGSDAIQNRDNAVPSLGNGWGGTPEPGDGRRQQVGLTAYRSTDISSGTSAALVMQGITA
jgi:hypothetical protein